MIEGRCDCGRVRLTLPDAPDTATSCNCSICTRHGTLWAYYPPEALALSGEEALVDYQRGDRLLDLRFCGTCGCVVHWRAVAGREAECFPGDTPPRIGVNMRLLDGFDPDRVTIRRIDGRSF